ncbi:hypothetical protein UA08_02465 [Talaromyces atroroseus]|uniref:Xylanolytic transcriptional activator regulatory domain-containing protein n=1 Tax=Talaromyces atroroseus TaxID=1441469 RepID=A0A225B768_TALAT|nr:hypothetical protein UA08_02465 [Talaromyces atroroseus]OKL61767.1 hypothetical protein UA08_02465 [Talaromyces atroroseus]
MQSLQPKLYDGEQLDEVAGFPTLYNFFAGDPQKPLVVFIPGNVHNARVAYGGHQGYEPRDFLAYWLNSHGHGLLAISYPLESEPTIMPATAPHFRTRDWGKQAAEVTHRIIKQHGLSNQVVLTAWSMGGRIVMPFSAAAQSLGIDVVLFVPLAATPGIYGLRPPKRETNSTAAGYAELSNVLGSFARQVQEQGQLWNGGRVIVPDEIYLSEYCGATPVSLSGCHLSYDSDSRGFVQDDLTSTEDAAVDQVQHCPMIVALTGNSPLDARHVFTDQATWSFVLTRKLMHEIEDHGLNKIVGNGTWDKLIEMVHSVPTHISYSIPGNHFFFLGEFGARETAAAIVKYLENASAFRRDFESLLRGEAYISDTSNVSVASPLSSAQPQSGNGTEMIASSSSNTQEASPEDNSHASRPATGDLNLESAYQTVSSSKPATQSTGTWLVENLKASGTPKRVSGDAIMPEGIFSNTNSATQKLLASLLEEECFSELPSEQPLSKLLTYYAEEVYPVFPIVNIKSFETDIDRNSKILLSQAMCLIASMSPQCTEFLYLRGRDDLLLDPRLFANRLFCAMRCVIDVGTITNKMVQLQALGALSLYSEGQEGPTLAAQFCAKMIQLVQTLGLHVQMENKHEEEHAVTALCCAWAIDRMNAAIHGRPVSMHERDIGRDFNECIEAQSPAFRLLLRVVSQLNQVIDLYRPQKNTKPAETEFICPRFEDLVISAHGANLEDKFLNTIEVLYLAVVIVSCRNREKPTHNRARQLLAASRITSLVRQEYGNELMIFSFVPYAVSLSLSIYYKQMRYNKVPLYRQRARSELQSTCDLLDQLSEHFYISYMMAKVGRATLAEMDRAQDRKNLTEVSPNMSSQPPPYSEINQPYDPEVSCSAVDNGVANSGYVDIFDLFDARFELQGVDAVFQSGLDLRMPRFPSPYIDRLIIPRK